MFNTSVLLTDTMQYHAVLLTGISPHCASRGPCRRRAPAEVDPSRRRERVSSNWFTRGDLTTKRTPAVVVNVFKMAVCAMSLWTVCDSCYVHAREELCKLSTSGNEVIFDVYFAPCCAKVILYLSK